MIRKIAAAAAACIFSSTGYCVDLVGVELGYGDDQTRLVRLSAQWRWRKLSDIAPHWRLAGYWDLSAAVLDNHDASSADVGVTPLFRLENGALYVEAAIGFHLVSRHISAARVFSTAFQFGDHIGVGFRSGRLDVALRLQHLSNGGLRRPNPGINFALLRFQYPLD